MPLKEKVPVLQVSPPLLGLGWVRWQYCGETCTRSDLMVTCSQVLWSFLGAAASREYLELLRQGKVGEQMSGSTATGQGRAQHVSMPAAGLAVGLTVLETAASFRFCSAAGVFSAPWPRRVVRLWAMGAPSALLLAVAHLLPWPVASAVGAQAVLKQA